MFDEYDPVFRRWYEDEWERRQRQQFDPYYQEWLHREYFRHRLIDDDEDDEVFEAPKKKDYIKEIDGMIDELKKAGFNCHTCETTDREKKVDIKTRDKQLKLGTATFDKWDGNHTFKAVKELQLRFLCGVEDEKILKTEYIFNGNTTYTKFQKFLEQLNNLERQYKLAGARIKKMEATMDFV